MYISGGSNIYPREIEEKILAHPAVAETAVLGIPTRPGARSAIAVCVPREGMALSEDDVMTFLFDKVARYKLPRRVILRESLPKSATARSPRRWCGKSWRRRASRREGARVSAPPLFTTLAQPGPARPERWLAAGGPLLHRAFALAPGRTLLDAVAGPLAGMRGGVGASLGRELFSLRTT